MENGDLSIPFKVILYCLMAYRYIISSAEIIPEKPHQSFPTSPPTPEKVDNIIMEFLNNGKKYMPSSSQSGEGTSYALACSFGEVTYIA